MRPRTAPRRVPAHRRPARGFKPVEQVLRAPRRPLVQHVHHQLSSSTVHLHVAFGVQIASASHPLRMQVVSQAQARGRVAAATTYPGVVFRDQIAPAGTVASAAQPDGRPVPHQHTASSPASSAWAPSAARLPLSAPPQVELVHRLPTPSAFEAGMTRAADTRTNASASRPGPSWPDLRAPIAPGATPLTAADLPGVIDKVVRDIDRRVVAARERRGWTS